ncbi:MAG TPA: RING finger protein [Limnochordia bacterium]
MAEPSLLVEKHSEYIAKQCPVCLKGIEIGNHIVLCTRCKVPHHEDCWYDNGGCGRQGCRGVASGRPTTVQSALAASRTAGDSESGDETAPQIDSKQVTNWVLGGVGIILLVWFGIWLLRRAFYF